jgi:hypothetical protein
VWQAIVKLSQKLVVGEFESAVALDDVLDANITYDGPEVNTDVRNRNNRINPSRIKQVGRYRATIEKRGNGRKEG